jgi:hypothetical protein
LVRVGFLATCLALLLDIPSAKIKAEEERLILEAERGRDWKRRQRGKQKRKG